VSDNLSWSHICELIKIDDDLERRFYENECCAEKWDVRTLRRQIDSALFLRIAASKDKEGNILCDNIKQFVFWVCTGCFIYSKHKEKFHFNNTSNGISDYFRWYGRIIVFINTYKDKKSVDVHDYSCSL
jgi:hypothetical protein